jgi:CRP-like cAMP-binding protein
MPLLEADIELSAKLAGKAANVGLDVVVPVRSVDSGKWVPSADLRRTLCVLVLEGLLLRTVERDGLEYLVVYGPADIIDFSEHARNERWTVRRAATLAAYDGRVVAQARRHPPLLVALLRRMRSGQREAELMAAVARITRVNERLLTLMRHLAGRWGKVTADGVTLDFPLTHSELGELIGARRPTVTIAIAQLAETGVLRRLDSGEWVVTA